MKMNQRSNNERTGLLSSNVSVSSTGSSVTTSQPRSRMAKNFSLATILAANTLERLAFYGLTGNFILFLQQNPFMWMSYNASNALFIFLGLSYVLCLFGGVIADACLGRVKAICIFFLVYICGYIFIPILGIAVADYNDTPILPSICPSFNNPNGSFFRQSPWIPLCEGDSETCNQTSIVSDESLTLRQGWAENCSWVVYLAVTLIAIGCGTIKTNIAPFGADQVKNEGAQSMRSFFNWFYWSVNIGSLLALGPIAFIQQELDFFIGYIIPCACLGCALIIFLMGLPCYVMKPPAGSVVGNCFKVITEAVQVHRKQRKFNSIINSITESSSSIEIQEPESWLDVAKVRFGGSFTDSIVDDVRSLGKITGILITMIPYWIVVFQMETTFLMQGLHMKLEFGSETWPNVSTNHSTTPTTMPVVKNNTEKDRDVYKMSVATLSLFDVVVIILLIPLMDKVIYPWFDRRGRPLTLYIRMLVGMICATFAVIIAGIVEFYRLKTYWKGGVANPVYQKIGNRIYYAADMNILIQIPQYVMIGLSEVFASIAGLELAYSQAPKTMQGIIMGLFWACSGVGSLLGTLIMSLFNNVWFFSWDLGDINCRIPCKPPNEKAWCHECHLDYYFFTLALVQCFGIVLFTVVSYWLGLQSITTKIHSKTAKERKDLANGSGLTTTNRRRNHRNSENYGTNITTQVSIHTTT